jgi:hypothetical protein
VASVGVTVKAAGLVANEAAHQAHEQELTRLHQEIIRHMLAGNERGFRNALHAFLQVFEAHPTAAAAARLGALADYLSSSKANLSSTLQSHIQEVSTRGSWRDTKKRLGRFRDNVLANAMHAAALGRLRAAQAEWQAIQADAQRIRATLGGFAAAHADQNARETDIAVLQARLDEINDQIGDAHSRIAAARQTLAEFEAERAAYQQLLAGFEREGGHFARMAKALADNTAANKDLARLLKNDANFALLLDAFIKAQPRDANHPTVQEIEALSGAYLALRNHLDTRTNAGMNRQAARAFRNMPSFRDAEAAAASVRALLTNEAKSTLSIGRILLDGAVFELTAKLAALENATGLTLNGTQTTAAPSGAQIAAAESVFGLAVEYLAGRGVTVTLADGSVLALDQALTRFEGMRATE